MGSLILLTREGCLSALVFTALLWVYRVIDLQFSQPPLCTWEHRQVPSGLNQGQVFLLHPCIPPEGEAVELITQQPHQNHFQLAIIDHPVSQAEL